MGNLLQELEDLNEELARAGLPEVANILGRQYICTSGAHLLAGTVTSVDKTTDDGYLCLGISSRFYRGDEIKYIVILSAKHLQLAVSDGNNGTDYFHAELKLLP